MAWCVSDHATFGELQRRGQRTIVGTGRLDGLELRAIEAESPPSPRERSVSPISLEWPEKSWYEITG